MSDSSGVRIFTSRAFNKMFFACKERRHLSCNLSCAVEIMMLVISANTFVASVASSNNIGINATSFPTFEIHEESPSAQNLSLPASIVPIPPVFIRAYYLNTPQLFDAGIGTLRVLISGETASGGYLFQPQSCSSSCPKASGCWHANSGTQQWYIFYQTEQRCFGISDSQVHTWTESDGVGGLGGLEVVSTFQDESTQGSILRTVQISIACDPFVHGNENFSLLQTQMTTEVIQLHATHACACQDVAISSPSCMQLGAVPKSELSAYATRVVDSADCDAKYHGIALHMYLAIAVVVVCFVADVYWAVTVKRKIVTAKSSGSRAMNVLDCLCCGFCDFFTAPFFPEFPMTHLERPALVIFGSAAGGHLLFSSLLLIFTKNIPGQLSVTMFAVLISVVIGLLTLPLVAGATCKMPSIGALAGLAYSLFGMVSCFEASICYLDGQHIKPLSLIYVPSGVCFAMCALMFARLLRPYCDRVYLQLSHWREQSVLETKSAPYDHQSVYEALPDTSAYVTELLMGDTSIKAPHKKIIDEPDAMTIKPLSRLFANAATYSSYMSSVWKNRNGIWVTAGEVKILTAVVLALCILGGLCAFWTVISEFLAIFITSELSTGKCCGKVDCYTAAGAPVTGVAAVNWISGDWIFEEFYDGVVTTKATAIAFDSSCATFNFVRNAIYHTVTGCAFTSLAVCVWHGCWLYHHFRIDVNSVQKGKSSHKVKASASTSAHVSAVKFVGTYVAYLTIGWLSFALFLLALSLVPAYFVLNYYGVLPGSDRISFQTIRDGFWSDGSPQWLTIGLINLCGAHLVVLLLQKTKRVRSLRYFTLLEQFLYVLTAVWAFVIRLLSSVFFQFMCMPRLDSKVIPSSIPNFFDTGYSLYLGLVSYDAFYSNKVMLAFVTTLQRENDFPPPNHGETSRKPQAHRAGILSSNGTVMIWVR